MITSNNTDGKSIINRSICHYRNQLIHNRRHILGNSRSKDNSRNQHIKIICITTCNNIMMQDSIQINTHLTSINRMLEEIYFGMINLRSIILSIGYITRITVTSIKSHTIITLNHSLVSSRRRNINEYIHTEFFINLLQITTNLFITICRNHSNVVDILNGNFMSSGSNMILNIRNNIIQSFNKSCRLNIVLLLQFNKSIENKGRQNNCRSSTITNSFNNMTSNRFYIILNRLLDNTIIMHSTNNSMTIFSIARKSILLLNTSIRSIRTKRLRQNLC